MVKRKLNENYDENGNMNKNCENKTTAGNYGNNKFENLTANISSKNDLKRNHIIDVNQCNNLIPKKTSTSLKTSTSMLKLNEDTKNEKIKSKFIIPVRKECSSSFNRTEYSLKVPKDISKTDNKKKNGNEKGVKSVHFGQNTNRDISTKMIQKTKTKTSISEGGKQSNDVNTNNTNKTDDPKQLMKKGKEKKSKEITNNSGGKKEVIKKVEKVDSKDETIVEVLEDNRGGPDNDDDNGDSNSYDNNNNDDSDKNNDDINGDNKNKNKNKNENEKGSKRDEVKKSNKNITNDKSDDVDNNHENTKNLRAVKGNDKNTNKMKGKKKDDDGNETEESDNVDTTITIQLSSFIPKMSKVAAAAAVKEDSMTTEAMRNVPKKALLTSLLPKLEEDVFSDDDSLSLGSEGENDIIEEVEEEMVRKGQREDKEMEVMKLGRISKKKEDNDWGNIDERKHLTPSHDADTNNNKNDVKCDNNIDDEDDDMFFAE